MNNITNKKLILKIYQLENDIGSILPAVEDIDSHEFTPSWTAGLMYVILDKYLSNIPDSRQQSFKESTIKWLAEMVKDDKGSQYVEKIDKTDII